MKDEHKALLLLGRLGKSEEGKGEGLQRFLTREEKKKEMGQSESLGGEICVANLTFYPREERKNINVVSKATANPNAATSLLGVTY